MDQRSSLRPPRALAAVVVICASIVLAGCDVPILSAWFDHSRADPRDEKQVAWGRKVYDLQCASCHGANLEGQPDWKTRRADGRLPAPPHDPSGHTWHHPDAVLFGITRDGLTGTRWAPPGYASDMPAFVGRLSDEEIWAVLAYIKSTWPIDILAKQRAIDREARRERGR